MSKFCCFFLQGKKCSKKKCGFIHYFPSPGEDILRIRNSSQYYFKHIGELETIQFMHRWGFQFPSSLGLVQSGWDILPGSSIMMQKLSFWNQFLEDQVLGPGYRLGFNRPSSTASPDLPFGVSSTSDPFSIPSSCFSQLLGYPQTGTNRALSFVHSNSLLIPDKSNSLL